MHGDFLVVKQMPIMCSTFLHKAGVFFYLICSVLLLLLLHMSYFQPSNLFASALSLLATTHVFIKHIKHMEHYLLR